MSVMPATPQSFREGIFPFFDDRTLSWRKPYLLHQPGVPDNSISVLKIHFTVPAVQMHGRKSLLSCHWCPDLGVPSEMSLQEGGRLFWVVMRKRFTYGTQLHHPILEVQPGGIRAEGSCCVICISNKGFANGFYFEEFWIGI